MDSSLYNESDYSPLLQSPLTPDFDECMQYGVDDPLFFGEPTSVLFADDYSAGAGSSLERRDSGSFLDFLPTGDTMPKPYPGNFDQSMINPNLPIESNCPRAWFSNLDSAGEEPGSKRFEKLSSDGYGSLPSPPNNEISLYHDGTNGSSWFCGKKRKKTGKAKQSNGLDRSPAQLRTASRVPKRYSSATAPHPPKSQEDAKSRAAHNQVEQQYRKRLNQQFERLLAILPQPDYDNDVMEDGRVESGSRGSMEKRMSKAEVLDLARKRIKLLEKENAYLEKQNRDLAMGVAKPKGGRARTLVGLSPVRKDA